MRDRPDEYSARRFLLLRSNHTYRRRRRCPAEGIALSRSEGQVLTYTNQQGRGDEEQVAEDFVRIFHRSPTREDLRRFRCGRAGLRLRLPMRSRRTIAALIWSF